VRLRVAFQRLFCLALNKLYDGENSATTFALLLADVAARVWRERETTAGWRATARRLRQVHCCA